MIVLVVVLTVALIATVWAAYFLLWHLEGKWADERRELLTRIQHPEIVPVKVADDYKIPEQEPDEWNLVGEIKHDPDYGVDG